MLCEGGGREDFKIICGRGLIRTDADGGEFIAAALSICLQLKSLTSIGTQWVHRMKKHLHLVDVPFADLILRSICYNMFCNQDILMSPFDGNGLTDIENTEVYEAAYHLAGKNFLLKRR